MRYLLQKCRYKLAVEASQPTVHLRILVGHANMIDLLIESVAVAEETYERLSNARQKDQRFIQVERRSKNTR